MQGLLSLCLLVGAVTAAPGLLPERGYLPPHTALPAVQYGGYGDYAAIQGGLQGVQGVQVGLQGGYQTVAQGVQGVQVGLQGAYQTVAQAPIQVAAVAAPAIHTVRYAAPVPVIQTISKYYHHYEAPEEDEIEAQQLQQGLLQLNKNVRVVFIKAPENNGLTQAVTQLAKQITEDKTAIYVLSKQADIGQLAQNVQQIQEVHTRKPEVHFVKYRTHEEAELAKANIQAQYETLGGSSQSTREAVSGVHNFAGSLSAPAIVAAAPVAQIAAPVAAIPLGLPTVASLQAEQVVGVPYNAQVAAPIASVEVPLQAATTAIVAEEGSNQYLPPDLKK